MSTTTSRPQYGNIIKPFRPSIGNIPAALGIAFFPFTLIVLALVMLTQWLLAAAVVLLGLVVAGFTLIRGRDGRNIFERRALLMAHRSKVRKGNHLYLAGPAGRVPGGRTHLPGLLAASELSEHRDSFNVPFGLIHVPETKHYTVVLEAFPDGDALVDDRHVDSQQAHWGAALAEWGNHEGIVAASVTVETAPDSGLRLERMMANNDSTSGSEFSRAVAAAIPRESQSDSPAISTRIAITFSGKSYDKEGSDRGLAAVADEIGNQLPVLIANLRETGAGTATRACTAQDIVDFTRTAYDPSVADLIETSRAEDGTGLTWDQAGPTFHDDGHLDRYFHDRAVSASWQMSEGPRGQFYGTSLKRMMEPTAGVLRKRVTILYRPLSTAKATSQVETDVNSATFTSSSKKRPSARQAAQMAYVLQSAREEAQGAGLVRFGMIVTVTCASSDELPRLRRVIPSLSGPARLRLRETLGNQAVAFQAGLPLGLVLPEHAKLSSTAREWF